MKYTIKPSVNYADGSILIETTLHTDLEKYAEQVTRELISTKDKAVRQALIALGWTPPTEEQAQ